MGDNTAETTGEIAAAKRWYVALTPLISGQQATKERGTEIKVEDIPDYCHDLARLERLIEERRSGLDAFDFISRLYWGPDGTRLWRDGEFHSNLLAWLLNPKENHGAHDYFVKGFLARTGAPEAMLSADWSQATVLREWENLVDGEWGYLDILVLNENQDRLLAIENKIFSEEHSCQLTRYRKALEDRYSKFDKHLVFLTPQGIPARRERERKSWRPASYAVVLEIVRQLVDRQALEICEDANAFLAQYATTLRRNIVPDTSTQQVARKIYLANRKLFESILNNRPNYGAELQDILKEAIAQHPSLVLKGEERDYLGFVPAEWKDVSTQKTSTASGYPLLHFGCSFTGDNAYINFGLEPGNEPSIRQQIANAINGSEETFNEASRGLNNGWTRFHITEKILVEADYDSWDEVGTRERIKEWFSHFVQNDVRRIAEFIANNVPEYK